MLFRKKPKSIPLETQLQTLAARGIALRPDRSIDELLTSFPREEYESQPYGLLLFRLGGAVEAEPWGRHFCDSVYCFDSECIEGDGAYTPHIRRLAEIAGPGLPIGNIGDTVDIEAGVARVEFELRGATHHLEPTVDDDWFDPAVITHLAGLLASGGSERRFYLHDTGDQNILIACLTPNQAKSITKATGLKFELFG